jgi:hypothetical protein
LKAPVPANCDGCCDRRWHRAGVCLCVSDYTSAGAASQVQLRETGFGEGSGAVLRTTVHGCRRRWGLGLVPRRTSTWELPTEIQGLVSLLRQEVLQMQSRTPDSPAPEPRKMAEIQEFAHLCTRRTAHGDGPASTARQIRHYCQIRNIDTGPATVYTDRDLAHRAGAFPARIAKFYDAGGVVFPPLGSS